jgi:hypothetical protein
MLGRNVPDMSARLCCTRQLVATARTCLPSCPRPTETRHNVSGMSDGAELSAIRTSSGAVDDAAATMGDPSTIAGGPSALVGRRGALHARASSGLRNVGSAAATAGLCASLSQCLHRSRKCPEPRFTSARGLAHRSQHRRGQPSHGRATVGRLGPGEFRAARHHLPRPVVRCPRSPHARV